MLNQDSFVFELVTLAGKVELMISVLNILLMLVNLFGLSVFSEKSS